MNARYQTGAQIRNYLEAIASRHKLTPLYRFQTEVKEVVYNNEKNMWSVTTSNGDCFTSRYVISAAGVLSKPVKPEIDGLEQFTGQVLHTSRWPDNTKLNGLRIGVLGTGSTGAQVIVATSEVASHLTVFQRTAQYVVPSGQRRLSVEEVKKYLANFEDQWGEWRKTRLACGFDEPTLNATDVSREEQRRIFERAWHHGGGFEFMFGTFADIVINPDANRAAAEFISGKIWEIVKDPDTARKLTPAQPYAKRPVSADGYYEAFNKPNVDLVSLNEKPILRATPRGIVTADGIEHQLDILILATGFEAVEGAYRDFRVVGREGRTLLDTWGNHPSAYLGLSTPDFPNFFTVLGPQGIFSNLAAGVEAEVNFIADVIQTAGCTAEVSIEARSEALARWTELCTQMANYTIFAQVKSWIFGSNVHGDAPRVLFYFGGLKEYLTKLEQERAEGFSGFKSFGFARASHQLKDNVNGLCFHGTTDTHLRNRNYSTVALYMHTRGQDRLLRHKLFIPDGISGLWTTETGKAIEIHGHESMAGHAILSYPLISDDSESLGKRAVFA